MYGVKYEDNKLVSTKIEKLKGVNKRGVWAFKPMAYEGSFVDLNMVIEQEENSTSENGKDAIWRVDLSLSLPEIGPLRVFIAMKGRELSVVFHSESSQVRTLADLSFGQLKERMILSDFRVKSITAQAMTEKSTAPTDPAGSSTGFEVRA